MEIIFCDVHSDHQISLIKVSFQSEQNLKYLKCLFEEDSKIYDYLALETIKVCDDGIIKKKNFTQIEEIEQNFSKFVKDILEEKQNKKKHFIQQVEAQNQVKEDFLKIYNEVSGKCKLKQLIQNKNGQSDYDDLKKFIQENQQQKESITNILKEQLLKLDSIQTGITNNFDQLKSTICKKIDSFFDPQNFNIIQNLTQQNQQQSQIYKLYGKGSFCDFKESKQMQIQELKDKNMIQIIKNNPEANGQVYFQYCLTKKKNTRQGKIFCNNSCLFYATKVVQGNMFYEIQKNLELEIRVELKNRQIDFLDYRKYINQLDENYELEQNTTYYLAIDFVYRSKYTTCIDLIYFQEIEN
ncbi:hypothetical protein ABPG72_013744 [Tetrahymena utriculariae]